MKKNIIVVRNEKHAFNGLKAYSVGDICLCLAQYDTDTRNIDDKIKIELKHPEDIHEAVTNTEQYLQTMDIDMGLCTCVTNINCNNGAVNIFLPGVAKNIAEKLNSDFYIAFMSINEAMIHSTKDSDFEDIYQVLRKIIDDVGVPYREQLTDKIYIYRKDLDLIDVAQ